MSIGRNRQGSRSNGLRMKLEVLSCGKGGRNKKARNMCASASPRVDKQIGAGVWAEKSNAFDWPRYHGSLKTTQTTSNHTNTTSSLLQAGFTNKTEQFSPFRKRYERFLDQKWGLITLDWSMRHTCAKCDGKREHRMVPGERKESLSLGFKLGDGRGTKRRRNGGTTVDKNWEVNDNQMSNKIKQKELTSSPSTVYPSIVLPQMLVSCIVYLLQGASECRAQDMYIFNAASEGTASICCGVWKRKGDRELPSRRNRGNAPVA